MARIPSQKPFGRTQDSWTNAGDKGKITKEFRERHEAIFGPTKRIHGHITIKYVNGKRVVIENPATHGPIPPQSDLTRLPPASRLY